MSEENKENLLDQGSKDLLQENSSKEELKTKVTSIQQEEEKSGQKINVPSPEELVARASSSMITNKEHLRRLIANRQPNGKFALNRKAMNRIVLAILDLPTDGLPVELKSESEKMAFALGQRMIADRFVIMQHHISQELRKRREKENKESEEKKSEDKQTSTEGGTNESEE